MVPVRRPEATVHVSVMGPYPGVGPALDGLAQGAALWRVHELVFAILACESEPVDPRL